MLPKRGVPRPSLLRKLGLRSVFTEELHLRTFSMSLCAGILPNPSARANLLPLRTLSTPHTALVLWVPRPWAFYPHSTDEEASHTNNIPRSTERL